MTILQAICILHPETTREVLAEMPDDDTRIDAVAQACMFACDIMQKYMLEHEETPKGKKRYTM